MYCTTGDISFKAISTYAKFKSGNLKPDYYFALNNALVLINNQIIKIMDPFLGQIGVFGFTFAPRGWALCDGQLISISSNTALFSLLGTMYGGDGRITFALPDLRGRNIVGMRQGPGLSPISQGEAAGVESVTLTPTNMPAHSHPVSVAVNTGSGEESASTNYIASHASAFSEAPTGSAFLKGVTSAPAGGGQPFSIRNPSLAINVCIATQGVYPPRQ
jgi:microcystin-dependent protein